MEYFLLALKKYADFTGRASRQEYWMFVLFYLLFYIGLLLVDITFGLGFLTLFYALAFIVPNISAAARRLHDTSHSGWWQLLYLVPFIGSIVIFIFLIQNSHADNNFGPNPKSETTDT